MTFKELKNKIKEEQKTLAHQIKIGKPLRKPRIYQEADADAITASHNLEWNQKEYRHIHIMYCQFFNNTPYTSIEQPRDGNKPSSYMLNSIKTEWEGLLDEALRDCA